MGILDDIIRQGALTARAGAQGALGLPVMLGEGINQANNRLIGLFGMQPRSSVTDGFNMLMNDVFPQPKNATERVAQDVASGMVPMGPTGLLGTISGASSGLFSGATREAGGGPLAQLAAGLLGGAYPSMAKAAAPQVAGMLQGYTHTSGLAPTLDVWHGSPHRFDKFDSSKIGTGEGAQAYGHGIYLAENPATARTYSADRAYVGAAMKGKPSAINYDDPAWIAQKTIDELGDPAKAKAHLEMVSRTAAKHMSKESADAVRGAIDLVSSGSVRPKGNLYKADLPDEWLPKMLDWDKPLSQQPGPLQKIAMDHSKELKKSLKVFESNPVNERSGKETIWDGLQGADLLDILRKKYGESAAAKMLYDAGIPGIRYLDGGSRGAGAGTSNYVVFPGMEDKLKILSRE